MNTLLEYLKNIDSIEDLDLKHTLEVLVQASGATIPEDADWYWQQQKKICLTDRGIVSLEPLKFLRQAEIVVLDKNKIVDISPLFELPNVYHLNLIWNKVESLEGIDRLLNLKELYLGNNQLEDISPLANCFDLRLLGLKNNRISDVSPLERLTRLQEVYLGGTLVTPTQADYLFGILPGCKVNL